jgi:lysophospholipid acyltransferase (LPLAT)-like uncharacterized protein
MFAVPRLFKWVMLSIMSTCPVRSTGAGYIQELVERGEPWLYCTWHNNIAMAVCRNRNRGLALMASASRDGELIARAIERLGNTAIRGSSSRRGGRAVRDMVRALGQGTIGAITPDGPRGPVYQCQPGAVWIAALAGCPLVPYELEARRQWRAGSWDRHKIPKPFSPVYEYIGEPFHVTRQALSNNSALDELQKRMLDNTRACRRAAGHGGEDV